MPDHSPKNEALPETSTWSIQVFIQRLKQNCVPQFMARIISFLLSALIIRNTTLELHALVNVRVTLLYTTLGFLVREPFRKMCLSSTCSLRHAAAFGYSIKYAAVLMAVPLVSLWSFLGSPDVQFDDDYQNLVYGFALSMFIELFVERSAIMLKKAAYEGYHATVVSCQLVVNRVLVLYMLRSGVSTRPNAYIIAQLVSSTVYAVMIKYYAAQKYESTWKPLRVPLNQLWAFRPYGFHAIMKLYSNEFATYIISFSKVMTLEEQGIYDIVERLCSIFVRVVLTPVEESAEIFFLANAHTPKVSKTYKDIMKILMYISTFILTFSFNFSQLAVEIYAGIDIGAKAYPIMQAYLFYLVCLSMNGLTEGYAVSTFTPSTLSKHAYALSAVILFLIPSTFVLASIFGGVGVILSSSLNSCVRFFMNLYFVASNVKSLDISIWELIPGNTYLTNLTACAVVLITAGHFAPVTLAELSIGMVCHVLVGGVLALQLLWVTLHDVDFPKLKST